jgi:hypothetical protein
VLGLSPAAVQQQLAAARPANDSSSRTTTNDSARRASMGAAPATRGTDGTSRAGGRRGRGQAQGVGSRYIVFVKRNGKVTPVWIRTGLTDLDYSEVLEGLTPSDSVLVLPSASLVQSQQDMKERFNRVTGGGAVPGMRQQTAQPPAGTRP